jgi:hypothetical protein
MAKMKRTTLAAVLLLGLATGADAQPMKCVDASGKVRYLDATLVGSEKCEPVKEGTNVVPPQPASQAPARPRASNPAGAAQASEARLAAAQSRLDEARKNLAEQEAIRTGGERNYARVEERLQPFQEAVQRAEQEVERIRRESR